MISPTQDQKKRWIDPYSFLTYSDPHETRTGNTRTKTQCIDKFT